jgi:ankyrin repeat protein
LVGRYQISTSKFELELQTTRYAYALKVLDIAHRKTTDKYPDWLEHEWIAKELGWREIRLLSKHRLAAEAYCDVLIKSLADSGELTVREDVVSNLVDSTKSKLIVIHELELTRAVIDQVLFSLNNDQPLTLSKECYTFKYEEITPHILKLDSRLLSLLNAEDGYKPLKTADKKLHDAAANLDQNAMRAALSLGADINSIDYGRTPLTVVVQGGDELLPGRYGDNKKQAWMESDEKKHLIKWLISRGADCNLFGFDGIAPLTAAVLSHNPEIVRDLLSHGADPESDQSPECNNEPVSSAQDYASSDLNCIDYGAPEELDVWEINVLLDIAVMERKLAKGRSLEQALFSNWVDRSWVGVVEAAYLFAKACERKGSTMLAPFLTDDAFISGEKFLHSANGKTNVLSSLQMRFDGRAMPPYESPSKLDFYVSVEKPVLVGFTSPDQDQIHYVQVHTNDGWITGISELPNSLGIAMLRKVQLAQT